MCLAVPDKEVLTRGIIRCFAHDMQNDYTLPLYLNTCWKTLDAAQRLVYFLSGRNIRNTNEKATTRITEYLTSIATLAAPSLLTMLAGAMITEGQSVPSAKTSQSRKCLQERANEAVLPL